MVGSSQAKKRKKPAPCSSGMPPTVCRMPLLFRTVPSSQVTPAKPTISTATATSASGTLCESVIDQVAFAIAYAAMAAPTAIGYIRQPRPLHEIRTRAC
jgi:hypothetical protein